MSMTAMEEEKAQRDEADERKFVTIYSGTELTKFSQQDAIIGELAEKYLPLTINGVNDRAGFDAVHKARMVVKSTRVAIEKKRKELKADALKYGQTVDAEARRLTDLLTPIESHLEEQEDAVIAEKERLKRAEEDARREALQKRLDALAEFGIMANPLLVGAMTIEQFNEEMIRAREQFTERKRAQEQADAKRKEEEAAIAAERARLAEEAAKLQAEREQVEAERRRVEAEAEAMRRAAELERARQDAAEKARVETERRIAEELERKRLEEERSRLAYEKAERERPQRERILAFAVTVANLPAPEGPGHAAVKRILTIAYQKIIDIANGKLE